MTALKKTEPPHIESRNTTEISLTMVGKVFYHTCSVSTPSEKGELILILTIIIQVNKIQSQEINRESWHT